MEQEQIERPSFAWARTLFHSIAAPKNRLLARTQSMDGYSRNVDMYNMQHPPWWENTLTIITQRRIEVCLEKVVNNTENEKYNAFFYLTDCSP